MFFNHVAQKILNHQINFISDIFYARLVHSTPANSIITASQIQNEASGGTYTRNYLSTSLPKTFINANNETYITDFGSASWQALTVESTNKLVGCIICRQIAGSIANTDWCIFYLGFPNTPNSPNGQFTPDASDLIIEFKNNSGILKFRTQ